MGLTDLLDPEDAISDSYHDARDRAWGLIGQALGGIFGTIVGEFTGGVDAVRPYDDRYVQIRSRWWGVDDSDTVARARIRDEMVQLVADLQARFFTPADPRNLAPPVNLGGGSPAADLHNLGSGLATTLSLGAVLLIAAGALYVYSTTRK